MSPRTLLLMASVACLLAGCSGAGGYTYADGQRKILYGVDGNGNALYRRPGEAPARASGAQVCLSYKGCAADTEEQQAQNINKR